MSDEPRHYSIFGADVQNYSGRHVLQQLDIRRDLRALLDAASREARVGRRNWFRQDQGDGELALVPGTQSKVRLAADFIRELKIGLGRYNALRKPDDRLRLRLVMHCGEAHRDGTGFAGKDPIIASRLLDAPQLRKALDVVPEANIALVLSVSMFEAVQGYRDIDKDDYRRVQVTVKEFTQDAWIAVPGFPPPELGASTDSESARTDGDARSAEPKPARPERREGLRRGIIGNAAFHGPVSFGDGPVAGRDINYGNR